MKTRKRLMALMLVICAVLSLAVPTAVSAEEETQEYVFPEYSKAVRLGEALKGGLSITQYAEILNKDGKDYILVNDRAGSLYIFKLTDYLTGADNEGSWIEAQITSNVPIPTGMVTDSQGTVYIVGDAAHIFAYNFYTDKSWTISLGSYSAMNITVDDEDNLYVATTSNPRTVVLKVDTRNNNEVTEFYTSDEFVFSYTVGYGDGHVYVQGQKLGFANGMEVHKLNKAGEKVAEITFDKTNGAYYLSYVDGVVFVGHSGQLGDGCIAIDAETMTRIDIGVEDYILGLVTDPNEEGKSYMNIAGTGIYEYDVATRKAVRLDGLAAANLNLRIRKPYLDVDFGGMKGKAIITLASGGAIPMLMSIEGQGFLELEEMVEEATSPATLRSVGPGVPGLIVKNDRAGTTAGAVSGAEVAVYTGGYIAASVGSYSPDLEKDGRINGGVFSNGHAQTDCLIQYNGKIYGGIYNGAYLIEYDPVEDTVVDLITNMKKEYKQCRIHCIVGGDNKLFFSTIPDSQIMGGCIGWYDLETKEQVVVPDILKDQSIIALTYDEKEKLLYCASSIDNGTQTTPTQEEALMVVYDVANRKKLGEFSVRASENPDSDMVFDLEGMDRIPQYICGMAQDPNTGKFWGQVSRTLFTFQYDRKANKLKIHEEWCMDVIGKNGYPASGSLGWFPRALVFDDNGYIYTNFELGGGFFRMKTDDPSTMKMIDKTSTRIYTLGSDGNLYFGDGLYLCTIALNRVSIVRAMIDGSEPKDYEDVREARLAYNALTEEEKAELSQEYHDALPALEGASRIFMEVAAEKTSDIIDEIGAVTASAGGKIMDARKSYELLDVEAKKMVTNYDALTAAETAFASISEKTAWGRLEKFSVNFSGEVNRRIGLTPLQMIKFDHINGGIWEYAFGTGSTSAMRFNAGNHLRLVFGEKDYIAFRFKVNEAGLYDITADLLQATGFLGGVYIFPYVDTGMGALQEQVEQEVSLKDKTTEHCVFTIDYNQSGQTDVLGQWNCEAPGEYLLVLNRLEDINGTHAYPVAFNFTKRDPETDAMVERVKELINDIGKVTKNSGTKIQEARINFDALSEAQKALIHAPQLAVAEQAYEEIMKEEAANNDAAVVLVKVQIDAIGEVTAGSGPAIQMAREAYEALPAEKQARVSNLSKLEAAEKAYAELTSAPAEPDTEQGGDMTMVIIVAAAVFVVLLVVILLIAKGKKKKAAPAEEKTEE